MTGRLSAGTGEVTMPGGRRLVRERRGAILVLVAVVSVTLMGFLAMTLDVGAGHRQRRIAQTAADAGAIAGGMEIFRVEDSATVVAAAKQEAIRNGFQDGDITIFYPPATGAHAGDDQYVEVLINKSISTIFGSIFNVASMAIQARGVAGVGTTSVTCIFALDPGGSQALLVEGRVEANCGVSVNSTAGDAMYVKPGANLEATSVTVSGGLSGGGNISPAPQTGVAPAVNPLAYLDMPAVGSCTYATQVVVTGTMNLNPGVYCGGISITNASTTANLSPGTYIMAGGGLTVKQSATINGNGVTIILTNGPGNNARAYAGVNFGTGCRANLVAPSSDPFKGILFFQDPDAGVAGTTYVNTFACVNNSPLEGTLYFPTQTVQFGGSNSSTQIDGGLIAQKIEVNAGTRLAINQPVTGNSPVQRVALVE